jgi:HD-GYP domain-containing protein (c-di-GMP phosphodiesterase class II)
MHTQLELIHDIPFEASEAEHQLLCKLDGLSSQSPTDWLKYTSTLSTLISALKAKDPLLYLHSCRVQHFTRQLTHALRLPTEEAKTIKIAALLHDIGKLGIHDAILHKASHLTPQEYETVKEHPARGAYLLSQIPWLKKAVPLVHSHHERWDGYGYPYGLRRKTIPLGARIIAIADAFEVMTSQNRTYQTPRSMKEALKELRDCAGMQFDRSLVTLFCDSLTPGFALAG